MEYRCHMKTEMCPDPGKSETLDSGKHVSHPPNTDSLGRIESSLIALNSVLKIIM
jgi:hypothetical protein